MQIEVTILNSTEKADVTLTHAGYIITNIWGTGLRVINSSELLNKIKELRDKGGRKAVFEATEFWTMVRGMNPEEVSICGDPSLIWGKSKVCVNHHAPDATDAILAPEIPATSPNPSGIRKLENVKEVVKKWKKFFSEFHFTPQVRFMNSLARCKSSQEVADYVMGYFSLTNNSYVNEVREKIKSQEFKDLAEEIYNTTDKEINARLEIYYGEPGGGKTTQAINDNPDAQVVICHASLSPDELFRGFDFTPEGKPTFKPCAVKQAMIEGKVVILDEINLLNEDCRRALQAICDGKTEVTINDEKITIAKGFKIIGTMNLMVDEQVFGLPAPLVDRALKIKEFEMTVSRLAELAF